MWVYINSCIQREIAHKYTNVKLIKINKSILIKSRIKYFIIYLIIHSIKFVPIYREFYICVIICGTGL